MSPLGVGALRGLFLAGLPALSAGTRAGLNISAVHDQRMSQRRLFRRYEAQRSQPFYLNTTFEEQIDDDGPYQALVMSQLVLLELAVRPFAGSPGQAAYCQEAFVTAEPVQKGVGITFAQGEVHDAGTEHGVSRVAWVAAVFVGRIEDFNQFASSGNYPRYHGLQEAVAAFRGLFALLGIIKIEIAHDDFCRSEGASDRLA